MAIGQELSSIDFQSMIGGPLNAVVRAQAQSAQTSVDFIKSVGFNGPDAKEDKGKPTMVTFEYDKIIETKDDKGAYYLRSETHEIDCADSHNASYSLHKG